MFWLVEADFLYPKQHEIGMKFILAEKQTMTQKYGDNGAVIPVTKVVAGPCVVTQVRTQDRDGYTAVQVGFGSRRKVSKPVQGHLGATGIFRYLREFRVPADAMAGLKVGDKITVTTFQPGDVVRVTGTSKGRGFQGVVKRHGFHGSPKTHGHKDQLRMPGSIGATGPAHVFKGTRMGGQMGNAQVTVTNLSIVEVNAAENTLYIKGAVPGATGNLILIAGEGELTMTEPQAASAEKPAEEKAAESASEPKSEAQPAETTPAPAETPAPETAPVTPQASEKTVEKVEEKAVEPEAQPAEQKA